MSKKTRRTDDAPPASGETAADPIAAVNKEAAADPVFALDRDVLFRGLAQRQLQASDPGPRTPRKTALALKDQARESLLLANQYVQSGRLQLGREQQARWESRVQDAGGHLDTLTSRVEVALSRGDAHEAATAGFRLGSASVQVYVDLLLADDARRGRRVVSGGRRGAAESRPRRRRKADQQHADWLAYAKTLQPSLTLNAAARLVARHFGVSSETVRKTLPKKPW